MGRITRSIKKADAPLPPPFQKADGTSQWVSLIAYISVHGKQLKGLLFALAALVAAAAKFCR